tara:strand:+ start:169 stop:945 length:777 start_codon:yes stop_codon:yes gene_type:complete
MNDKKLKIEALKENGYQLEFENVFNLAFENYKKIALYAGLMIFVFSIIIGIIFGVAIISYLGVTGFTELMEPNNINNTLMTDSGKVAIMVVTIIGVCILSPFPAGLIKMAACAQKDEEFHVSTAFTYYKAPYFKELVISTLLIGIFGSALNSAIGYLGVQYLGILVSTIISFITMLVIPLIIFSDLKATDAITSSIVLVSKQPLILIGLFVVSYLLSLVGFFGCCIGLFFTLPLMYSLYFAVYSEIVGFEETTDDDRF